MIRFLITFGLMMIIIGFFYPQLQKLGLGEMPGDLSFEKSGFIFYFPITSSIIASCTINLLIWCWGDQP